MLSSAAGLSMALHMHRFPRSVIKADLAASQQMTQVSFIEDILRLENAKCSSLLGIKIVIERADRMCDMKLMLEQSPAGCGGARSRRCRGPRSVALTG